MPVCEHQVIRVSCDQTLQADRKVLVNRPDIMIKNKKNNICMMKNVAMPRAVEQ
jgi:ATP-dependent Zn protease